MKSLQQWLQQREWALADWERIPGGYAADLYKVTLLDATGHMIPAVYKKLARARESEVVLYNRLLSALPVDVPKLLGIVQESDGQGLLLEYGGQVLKPFYQNSSHASKQQMLSELVEMLATLHAGTEAKTTDWLHNGTILTYPYTSSMEWGEVALKELAMLQQQRIGGVTKQLISEMRQIIDEFYPRYAEWTSGRTTLTHGDPHMENILYEQDKYQLIDWEWACVSVPQRDLSILLQDVLDEDLHAYAWHQYQAAMKQRGWNSDSPQFTRGFLASMVDNTLMMLGWEVKKYRGGHLTRLEIETILAAKVPCIRTYYERLSV